MGGAALPPLLDTYTGAAAAYSLRKLKSDYTGKVLQVRRASDHVEVDVGFDSNGLLSLDSPVTNVTEESTGITQGSSTNAAKLGEFCGEARRSGGDTSYASVDSMTEAAHIEVVTWYDQSGNANNATQVAAAFQPRIYDRSSGLIVENGKPAIEGDGNKSMAFTSITFSDLCFVNVSTISHNISALGDAAYGGASGTFGAYGLNSTTLRWRFALSTADFTIPAQTNGTQYLAFANRSSTSLQVSFQGNVVGTELNSAQAVIYQLLNGNGNGLALSGTAQEFIFYPSDQSAYRTNIETNINTFYSIYQ